MPGLSILYVGNDSGTAAQRAMALKRLGHRVHFVDPFRFLPRHRLIDKWVFDTGGLFVEAVVRHGLLKSLPAAEIFDLVFIDNSELVGAQLVTELRRRFGFVLCYSIDDPFGGRDGWRWRAYFKALPLYDLLVVVRECNVREAMAAGVTNVMRVYMSADEVIHSPVEISEPERARLSSEVAFVGSWMPERGPLLLHLVQAGIPLTIYGNRWPKAKEWKTLSQHWKGPSILRDREYSNVVQCSKVCLGLLSKGNRDQTTTRSFEIPRLGVAFCAERTLEHQLLYKEDVEAVFWSSPDECVEKCYRLLRDSEWRNRVAEAGRKRCLKDGTGNEQVLQSILNRVEELKQQRGQRVLSKAQEIAC